LHHIHLPTTFLYHPPPSTGTTTPPH
jgi:hypothetical protein